jgi:hypothetical protein
MELLEDAPGVFPREVLERGLRSHRRKVQPNISGGEHFHTRER